MSWVNANVGIENQSVCESAVAWENAGGNLGAWVTNGKWNSGIYGVNCVGLITLGTPKWIFGDSQYGLYYDGTNNMPNIHTYYNGVMNDLETGSFRFDLNWGDPAPGLCCIFVGINEDTQRGTIMTFQSYYDDPNRYSMNGTRIDGISYNSAKVYEIIKHAEVIPHQWKPIKSVGGKLGLFEFSMIKEEYIGDGSQVTDAPSDNIERFINSTSLSSLGSNLFLTTPTEVIYSGDDNSMVLYKFVDPLLQTTLFVLYFYIGDTQIYTYTNVSGYDEEYLSFVVDEENEVAAISMIYTDFNPTSVTYNNGGLNPSHDLYLWFAGNYETNPDENEPDPDEGANPWQDEEVPGLDTPTISAIDTGFTSMYVVTDSELRSLAHYLWTSDFVTNIKKLFSDPREIIIGLSMFPVTPDYGSSTNIKAGGIDTGITGKPLTSQYKLLDDFGSIYMQKEKGCFLDYPPFTKITAHLPYVGEHELDVNDIAGKTIKLKYLFDFLTGACVAEIDVNGKPRYFFSGQTGVQIPTSSEDFTRQFTSFLAAGVGIGTALAAPSVGAAAAPIAMTAVNAINAGLSPSVQYSSGGGGVNGFLSTQGAFITIELPDNKLAGKQPGFVGKPSYIYADHLENCKGYIKCFAVHVDEVNCLPSERRDIEQQLLAGVRIEDGSETPTYTPTETGDFGFIFLKMLSDLNVIGKTWDENDEFTIEGKIVYEKDITKPVLLISGNISAYNYCYIPHFNRFYHIDEIVCKTGTMQEAHLSVDALQSFKSDLLDCDAILERAEDPNYVNSKFNDAYMWTQQNKRVKTVNFKASGSLSKFDRNNNVYILTIAGG